MLSNVTWLEIVIVILVYVLLIGYHLTLVTRVQASRISWPRQASTQKWFNVQCKPTAVPLIENNWSRSVTLMRTKGGAERKIST